MERNFPFEPLVQVFKINHTMTSTETYIYIILFLNNWPELPCELYFYSFISSFMKCDWILPVIYNWITFCLSCHFPVTYCHLGKVSSLIPFPSPFLSWTAFWCRGWERGGRLIWHHVFARGALDLLLASGTYLLLGLSLAFTEVFLAILYYLCILPSGLAISNVQFTSIGAAHVLFSGHGQC